MKKILLLLRDPSFIVMLLLSLSPILGYYSVAALSNLTYAYLSFIIYLGVLILRGLGIVSFPKPYYFLWGYVAVMLIVLSGVKITYLIPGGITFFVWSLILGASCRYFDLNKLYKCLKVIFIISAFIFIIQEVMYAATGTRFVAFLPLGKLTSGLSYLDLYLVHKYSERSASIFSEPATFAQFSLLLLAIELFCNKNKEKLFTPFSIFIAFVLLFLSSGNGIIGLAMLVCIKLISYFFRTGKNKILAFCFALPIVLFAVNMYIKSKEGSSMMSRTDEFQSETSSGYVRVFRGYDVFNDLPTTNKMIGISNEDLLRTGSVFKHSAGSEGGALYFNGVQNILIHYGYLGLVLFFLFYLYLYKGNTLLSKVLIWIFLVLSLMSAMYLSSTMMIITSIAMAEKMNKKNSVL